MRSVLGQLRRSGQGAPGDPPFVPLDAPGGKGLSRLDALRDAVSAAGASVTVQVEGNPSPLPAGTDHSAYRILQESLTNVLRHAGPGAAAHVCLRYQPAALTITVTDTGPATAATATTPASAATPASAGTVASGHIVSGRVESGHGIDGMRERAAAAGGTLIAEPLPGGGFQVQATLPRVAPGAGTTSAGQEANS
jgi:signal transduction histidine kinase